MKRTFAEFASRSMSAEIENVGNSKGYFPSTQRNQRIHGEFRATGFDEKQVTGRIEAQF